MDRVADFHHRQLEGFRSLVYFSEVAVARALDYCAEHSICPPHWVVQGANQLLLRLLAGQKSTKIGRHAACVTELRQELYDVQRWDAVQQVRYIRAVAVRDDELLAEGWETTDEWLCIHRKKKAWLKQGNYVCAAELLLGTDAFATPRTIRRSARRIDERREPSPFIAAWFSDSFLRTVGLPGMQDLKPGHKLSPFFDLPKRQAKQHSAARGIKSDRMIDGRRSAKATLGKTSS